MELEKGCDFGKSEFGAEGESFNYKCFQKSGMCWE